MSETPNLRGWPVYPKRDEDPTTPTPDRELPTWVRWLFCHLGNRHRFIYSRLGKALVHPFTDRPDRWCNLTGCGDYHRRECMDCDRREEWAHSDRFGEDSNVTPWRRVVNDGNL